MANLYVIGIGGTGSRVIRSLTMLLASGVSLGDFKSVYPIIIDPDETNGDKRKTIELLKKYVEIQNRTQDKIQGDMFSTRIENIKQLQQSQNPAIRDFQFSTFYGNGQLFRNQIKFDSMPPVSQDLVKTLFSKEHLDYRLKEGFYGNPNIGVSVLNSFENSTDFEIFSRNFGIDDRVFIVASIFGGTGASGLPLLVKTFRKPVQAAGANAMKECALGACVILPYYNLSKEDKISSTNFITKAKAALSYYEHNLDTINDLYYVGDYSSFSHDYHEGGAAQTNNAHLVELISATSIVEFAHKNNMELTSPNFNEYYFDDQNSRDDVDLYKLGRSTKSFIATPLSKMFLLSHLHKKKYYEDTQQPWITHKDMRSSFFSNGDGKYLEQFLNLYKEWLEELSKFDRKFTPFNLETDDFEGMILGMPTYKNRMSLLDKILGDKFGINLFHSRMSKNKSKIKTDGLPYYLDLYDKASTEIINDMKLFT